MAEGEFALVQKYLEVALHRTAAWVGEHDLYSMLADAAAQRRDEDALQKYAPLAEEFASRYDHKLYQAIAHRAWGVSHRLADQYTEARTRLQRALELFQQLDTRWQIGRTYFELGELDLSNAEDKSAQEQFSRALSAFEVMGALPDVVRTREKMAML
jgi:tetratricopeptide (TPR) repeat protein